MHVNVRIEPRWGFDEVRRAPLALSRETSAGSPRWPLEWWREERRGVFLDYTRTPRIGPRARRTRCVRCPTPACRRRFGGRGPGMRARGLHRADDARALGALGIRTPEWTRRPVRSKSSSSSRPATKPPASGMLRGRPHFRKTAGEAPRVAPSRAQQCKERQEREPREPGTGEARSPGRAKRRCSRDRREFSSKEAALAGLERMEAKASARGSAPRRRRHPHRLDARSVIDLDSRAGCEPGHVPKPRPPQGTPDPDDDPTREWRRLRSAYKKED